MIAKTWAIRTRGDPNATIVIAPAFFYINVALSRKRIGHGHRGKYKRAAGLQRGTIECYERAIGRETGEGHKAKC